MAVTPQTHMTILWTVTPDGGIDETLGGPICEDCTPDTVIVPGCNPKALILHVTCEKDKAEYYRGKLAEEAKHLIEVMRNRLTSMESRIESFVHLLNERQEEA